MSNGIQDLRRSLSKENPFYLVMFIVVCLSPLLSYGLPDDVLTAWPWAKSFADFMSGVIPAIKRLTELSKFPEVTSLFMSLQWAIWGPVCVWLTFKFGHPTGEKMIDTLKLMQARWWYVFFFPPVFAVAVWFLIFLPFPNLGTTDTPFDQVIRWVSESRFWLGIVGSLFVTLTALFAMFIFRSYIFIRLAYKVRESSSFYRKKKD